jgi:proteasome lid subunit RPN8/RPN11
MRGCLSDCRKRFGSGWQSLTQQFSILAASRLPFFLPITGHLNEQNHYGGYPRACAGGIPARVLRLRYPVWPSPALHPIPNTHENPTEHFRIDGEHWANAEDEGTIIRVIHSHPGDGARPIPSDLDRQQCNNSGVVWGIYAPDCDEYAEITPEAIPLIGRPFILGSHDCWGLIMDWHATQGVMLNDFRVDYPWWESQYPDNLISITGSGKGSSNATRCPAAWSSCRLNLLSGITRESSPRR